jgi:hypothetical protein
VAGSTWKRESALCLHTTEDRRASGLCVRTQRHKYIYWGAARPEQFFDLEEDPLERRNRMAEAKYRDEVDRHRLLALDRLAREPAALLGRGARVEP